ncbi:MAG: hypothetical protein WCI73_04935 [Phycisphaerae bacterium]
MSKRTQLLGRVKVVPLDQVVSETSANEGVVDVEIPEALDRMSEEDSPFHNVRRKMDYPYILKAEKVSPKARRVFRACAEDWTSGRGLRLSTELMASPGRISQLKDQVGTALRRHDYLPPPTRDNMGQHSQLPTQAAQVVRRAAKPIRSGKTACQAV